MKEFFATDDTLYNFLKIVCTTFESALNIYGNYRKISNNSLLFVYKGGNVLRFVAKGSMIELPAHQTNEIREFFLPYFTRSDADFSILIDPTLENFNIIHHECSLLSYLLQDKIRDIFDDNSTDYFNFLRYNKNYRQKILASYLDKLNQVEGFENEFLNVKLNDVQAIDSYNFNYKPAYDIGIDFIDPEEDWLKEVRKAKRYKIKEPKSIIAITYNNALDFPGGNSDIRQRFNLVRSRIVLTLLRQNGKTLNIQAELIDVSIPHNKDTAIGNFYKHINENITNYSIKYKGDILEFHGYSLGYLTHDIEDILFVKSYYPWIDIKYTKRIYRLIYLYFVDIFVNIWRMRLQILGDFKNIIIMPLITVNMKQMDNMYGNLEIFMRKYEKFDVNIINFILNLDILYRKITKDQILSLNDMAKNTLIALDYIIKNVKDIKKYCITDGNIQEKTLYELDLHDFS